jgi:hypothetical protein
MPSKEAIGGQLMFMVGASLNLKAGHVRASDIDFLSRRNVPTLKSTNLSAFTVFHDFTRRTNHFLREKRPLPESLLTNSIHATPFSRRPDLLLASLNFLAGVNATSDPSQIKTRQK